jgi:hypothetical protein
VIELYKKDVDRTLLRQNLRRSVEERILNLMELQKLAEELRRAGGDSRKGGIVKHQVSPRRRPSSSGA